MTKEDLRLLYLAANKTAVTAEELETIILRAFAAHFCGDADEDVVRDILEYTANCLAQVRVHNARETGTEEQQLDDAVPVVQGAAAEKYYTDYVVQLLIANGDDKLYAEESASWPDVLPYGALWCPDVLEKIAKLEVGHHLLVRDYLQATVQRRQKETNGSV